MTLCAPTFAFGTERPAYDGALGSLGRHSANGTKIGPVVVFCSKSARPAGYHFRSNPGWHHSEDVQNAKG